MNLMHRDDPRIQNWIDQIEQWLERDDFTDRQRREAIRQIDVLSQDLLSITPPFDGTNSEFRHIQTVKSLDAWYSREIKKLGGAA